MDNVWDEAAGRLAAKADLPVGARDDAANDLELIAERYGPSKRNHDYLRWYDLHFSTMRHAARRVVEIGVETDRSIRMWEEYFPNAEIVGIDIAEHCRAFEGGRRRVFIGDQNSPAFMQSVVDATGGEFDIVIDDGLNTPRSMMLSFCSLFPAMRRGGIYVIEDIIRQPQTVDFVAGLARAVSHWPEGHETRDWAWMPSFADQPWLTRNVVGVAIYRYLAFVTRGSNPTDNPYLMTQDEYLARKQALRDETNAAIDAIIGEGGVPTAIAVSARIGNRGLTTIREELSKRGLMTD